MLTSTCQYLLNLTRGINAEKGTDNCSLCALRFVDHLIAGENLNQGPVPKFPSEAEARLDLNPLLINNVLCRSTSQDTRLQSRVKTNKYVEICDLSAAVDNHQKSSTFFINLEEQPTNTPSPIRLMHATFSDIHEKLPLLRRSQRDGSAYGIIILTWQDTKLNADGELELKAHVMNFFVDKNNQVFFIDSQHPNIHKRVTRTLPAGNYQPEIFFIQTQPEECLIVLDFQPEIKKESSLLIKREKGLGNNEPTIASEQNTALVPSSESLPLLNYTSLTQEGKVAYWREEARKAPQQGFTWLCLAKVLRLNRCEKECFEAALKATQIDKDNAIGWYELGLCYVKGFGTIREPNLAFKAFQQALTLNENFVEALFALGKCYELGLGSPIGLDKVKQLYAAKAYKEAQTMIGLPHFSPYEAHALKEKYFANEDMKQCFQYWLNETRTKTYDATPWVGLALAYMYGWGIDQDVKAAFQAANQATQADSRDIDAWRLLACLYAREDVSQYDLSLTYSCLLKILKLLDTKTYVDSFAHIAWMVWLKLGKLDTIFKNGVNFQNNSYKNAQNIANVLMQRYFPSSSSTNIPSSPAIASFVQNQDIIPLPPPQEVAPSSPPLYIKSQGALALSPKNKRSLPTEEEGVSVDEALTKHVKPT